jgi:hypothetical protein
MSRRVPRTALGAAFAAALATVVALLFFGDPGTSSAERGAARPGRAGSRAAVARETRAASVMPVASSAAAPSADRGSGGDVHVAFVAPWGGGPSELGRKRPSEGAPEGPASFVVDADGRSWVLDQVNSRVQVFRDGKAERSIPLPADTFQDLALDGRGGLIVLDRLVTASVAYLDPSGRIDHEVGLLGPGVSEGGAVTGMFKRGDGVWVEVEHQRLVRVADASGKADSARPTMPGRLTSDGGSVMRASIAGRDGATLMMLPADPTATTPERTSRVSFSMPVAHLTALESDSAGRVFLGAALMRERPVAPFDVVEQGEVVVVLGPGGTELRRFPLPANVGPEEQFRNVRLGDDGAVYQLGFDERAATMRRFAP